MYVCTCIYLIYNFQLCVLCMCIQEKRILSHFGNITTGLSGEYFRWVIHFEFVHMPGKNKGPQQHDATSLTHDATFVTHDAILCCS